MGRDTGLTELDFALLGVTLGGAIAVVTGEGQFDIWDALAGTVFALVLIAYKPTGRARKRAWQIAHSAAWSLSITLILLGLVGYAGLLTGREAEFDAYVNRYGILAWPLAMALYFLYRWSQRD